MLLYMYALYKLVGTRADTQLMHWNVLSEKIGNVTKCSVYNFTFHMDASHISLMVTMYMI